MSTSILLAKSENIATPRITGVGGTLCPLWSEVPQSHTARAYTTHVHFNSLSSKEAFAMPWRNDSLCEEFPIGSPNTQLGLCWLHDRVGENFPPHVKSLLVNGQNNVPTKPCMFLYILPVTCSYSLSCLILRSTLNMNNLGTLDSQTTWVEFNSWDF